MIVGIKMNLNAVNQFSKGSEFYTEGELVFSVAMIIKGRVLIHNKGAKIVMSSGAFLGINDLYSGRYLSTYTALDDLMIYVYPVNRIEELEVVLSSNKDYHGFMVASFYKMIYELEQIHQGLIKNGSELYDFLKSTYKNYLTLATRWGYKARISDRIAGLVPLDSDLELISDRINYYMECRNLPLDAVKMFFSYGNAITLYQIEDEVNIVNQQLADLKELADEYTAMAECLINESETCLFKLIAEISVEVAGSNGGGDDMLDIMDGIIEEINKAELFTEKMLGKKLKISRKKMEEVYHLLLTGNKGKEISTEALLKYSKEDSMKVLAELSNSFKTILDFAGISGEKAEEMELTLLDYVNLRDKLSTDDSARAIRRKITENHYEIYKPIFIKAHREKKVPRVIDLFLKYGFADERLLTKEQLLSLYFLPEDEQTQGLCTVYDIKTWLTLIYEGKREPSKNEFDLEYTEYLTSLKKQGNLTEKEVIASLNDPNKKLEYEIQNMFRYNNRTTNGQITSFVPVLHKDLLASDFGRLFVTAAKVNETINSIMSIDYSVFDREVLYVNKEKNIVKEYIMKRVLPDIILMPNVGSNGVMWQEISGKRRDSSGRFLLPTFTDITIGTLLVRILGKYRWELCRTIEGPAWNDISHKSLTSEYCDYLQFYRKNKDLSEEKKEKIKSQIQKGRNNNREIFVIDYEHWINYEAIGALKLNKPVREILATHVPFAKEIREQIKSQPLFEEAMSRYYREKQKKVREIEGRYRLLQKDNIEVTPELLDTLNYHRDL